MLTGKKISSILSFVLFANSLSLPHILVLKDVDWGLVSCCMFPHFSGREPLTFPAIIIYMYMYWIPFSSINVLLLCLLFILTSHITYLQHLMLQIIFMSHLLCFPHVLCLCVCVCVSRCGVCACSCACRRAHLCTCTCVHAPPCCRGAPEEEGRPRRRRTPRFLLKPWTRCRQATESRQGLQVNKTRRELGREDEKCHNWIQLFFLCLEQIIKLCVWWKFKVP